MEKLKVFEAFAGYGSQLMALKRIGVDCEVVAVSEIDRHALVAYDAVHDEGTVVPEIPLEDMRSELARCNVGLDVKTGKLKTPKNAAELKRVYEAHVRSKNLGDISKLDPNSIPDHDLFTYSFPCQDISNVGLQRGFSEGEGTRSGLLWECKKVIEAKRPKYLLMENVKNIVSKKHMPNFAKWCEWLESQGYRNSWKVLNAKDYGIPQNRERCFMVSVLDGTGYDFPEPMPLERKLRNLLEAYVDPKFYLKGTKDFFIKHSFDMEEKGNGFRFVPHVGRNANIAKCILTRAGGRMDDNFIIEMELDQDGFTFSRKNPLVLDFDGTHVKIKEGENGRVMANADISIRKLTHLECFRLMGCTDDDALAMIRSGVSDGELFKLAGNSIVVNVLEEIFRNLLLTPKKEEPYHAQHIQEG